jgi:leucyl-tRNA synthetase
MTIKDCINKFGADATRITLADAGDGLDDANFDTDVANASILKLYTLEKWYKDNLNLAFPKGGIDFTEHKKNIDMWDHIFDNSVNHAIEVVTQNYDEMKFK